MALIDGVLIPDVKPGASWYSRYWTAQHYYDWKRVVMSGRETAYNLLFLKALILTIMSDRSTTETRPKHDFQIGINMPRSSSMIISESAAVELFFMQLYRFLTRKGFDLSLSETDIPAELYGSFKVGCPKTPFLGQIL